MNTKKIKSLAADIDSLNSLKVIKYPRSTAIEGGVRFEINYLALTEDIMNLKKFTDEDILNDLNSAIRPVIDKYIYLLKEEIQDEMSK